MALIIVGLGPGEPGQVTRAAWDALSSAAEVYLRTRVHPTIPHLPEGPIYHSMDELYEAAGDFAQVYKTIVEQLLTRIEQGGDVVYAVPGDPLVGEGTAGRLLAVCGEKGIETRIIHGVSFIEPTLAALGIDAIDGVQLLDAIDLAAAYHPSINSDAPALIAQVYDQQLASDVKLTLMNQYPDEHPVRLVHAAGTAEQHVEALPLYEIDRSPQIAHLTTLFVPPLEPAFITSPRRVMTSLLGFQDTIAHLRAPDGCPWDREQTHQSLRPNLLEETYELLAAIDADDPDALREELGDLLLQIILHGQVAVDEGEFHMGEVVAQIDAKIKRRHPHVWGEVDVHGSAAQVSVNWEQIKARERSDKGEDEKSLLDGVPKMLPALAQAHEYDTRAARVGFDWPDAEGVIDKVHEELEEALTAQTDDDRFWEIGDLLLVVAVWARWLKINPEDALRAANRRFYQRFTHIEREARRRGRALGDLSFEELDALWNDAKNEIGLSSSGEE